jgi:ribosomal protein L20
VADRHSETLDAIQWSARQLKDHCEQVAGQRGTKTITQREAEHEVRKAMEQEDRNRKERR